MPKHTLSVNGMTIDELLAFHRAAFGNARMEGGEGGEGGPGGSAGPSFTQADVDAIAAKIRAEERRKASEKYADYDELKAKAEGAKTLEERIADLEAKGSESVRRALRAEVAGEFGISTKRGPKGEPSDAELFLTGADEDTLRSQAERLAERKAERERKGNHVPLEGENPKPGEDEMRDFAQKLFAQGD